MDFEKRKEKFEQELEKLLDKYEIGLDAANMVAPNMEVYPVIKTIDLKKDGDKS